MARVPVATRTIENRPIAPGYQSAEAPIEAFGGGAALAGGQEAARLLERGSDKLSAVALRIEDEDNTREVKRLDVEMSSALRAIAYGDGTEQNPGYYGTKGENAIQNYDPTAKAIEEARKRLVDSASNPKVRENFELAAAARVNEEFGRMGRHRLEARRTAANAISEARLGEAADDMAASWNDPATTARSLAIISAEAESLGLREGWTPEIIKSKIEEARTVGFQRRIEAALVQDPAAAQKIYEDNKTLIDGRQRAAIEQRLEAGVLRQQSQQATAEIKLAHPGDLAAQIEAAKRIANPKVQDETIARLDAEHARSERLRAQADRQNRQSAWQTIISGGSIDQIPARQLAALDGTTIGAMREFDIRRAKDGTGYAKASDPVAKNELHAAFMQDKVEFAQMDITPYLSRLTESDYAYWQSQQRAVDTRLENAVTQDAKARERQRAKDVGYALADKLARRYMLPAGIDPAKKTEKNQAKVAIINDAVHNVVDRLNEGDKTPSQAEFREAIEKELKTLFLSGEVDGSGWIDDTGLLFTFDKTQRGAFVVTNIEAQAEAVSAATGVPVEHLKPIEAVLKKRKQPATLANISALYAEAQNGR